MARTARSTLLENRSNRLALPPRKEPYWQKIGPGVFVGYYRVANGGTWWARKLIPGRGRYQKSAIGNADDNQDADGVEVLTYFQATDKVRERAAQHAKQGVGTPLKPLTVAEAAERYLVWFRDHRKSLHWAENTIRSHVLPTFGARPIAELKTLEIREFLDKLATLPRRMRTPRGQKQRYWEKPQTDDEKRARRATANRVFAIFKALLNKAFQDELVPDDSAWRRVKALPHANEPVIRFLTTAECMRLMNACPPDLRQFVQAALFTGTRFGELASLQTTDVQLAMGKVYIRPSKSGKARHVPLSTEGADFFAEAVAGKLGSELVFVKADGQPWGKNHHVRLLQEGCRNAKIEPVITFHQLRHTYASLLAQAGADLLTISKLLGHADTRITSRHYAHLCDQTLATAVRTLLPSFGYVPEGKIRAIR